MTERNGNSPGSGRSLSPHDEMAEQCVLACFQWDDDLFDTVPLRIEHFYKQHHQTIFRVMCDLHNRGIPTDAVTVTSALNDRNLLADVGGADYVLECMQITPRAVHVQDYARIIREKARLRKLQSQCTALAKACSSGGVTWGELNDGIGDLRDLLDDCDTTDLKSLTVGEFIETYTELKPPVIEGLIRRGESCNIIASPKLREKLVVLRFDTVDRDRPRLARHVPNNTGSCSHHR